MVQRQINTPGQQQVVDGTHQAQAALMAQFRCLKAEIDIRALLMAPHGP